LQPYRGCWIAKLMSDSFCENKTLQDEYSFLLSYYLCCSRCVTFTKQCFSVYDDLFLSMLNFPHCSFSLILSSSDADITSETGALHTPNNMAVFVTDPPAKRVQAIYPLTKSDSCPIFRFFHTDSHSVRN
jgi:hypothetical protein